MAEIRPFRGCHYDQANAGDLASLIAPPYDVISPALQKTLYDRSPYNVVRLELTTAEDTDPTGALGEEARHGRAHATLEAWLAGGVLSRDQDPSVYFYEQRFDYDGRRLTRRSILPAVRLSPWSAGEIVPHERTLSAPKAERLALLRATGANISPIWALYDDPSQTVAAALDQVWQADPLVRAIDQEGVEHTLWAVNERGILHRISQSLAPLPFYIADGHHRYETALAFREEGWALHNHHEVGPRDFVLMALTAADDPGLIVLPTYRLVHGVAGERLARLTGWLAQHFDVSDLASPADPSNLRSLLTSQLPGVALRPGEHRFALLGPEHDRLRLLRLRTSPVATRGAPLADLDVWLAHSLILEQGLGIALEDLERQEHLTYTRDASEALTAVRDGTQQLALFLPPTPVEQLLRVARAGEVMPQKSTYFYPKPATGMVIRILEPR